MEWFSTFTRYIERAAGSPWAFILAVVIVIIWWITGPFFGFSDTWQLVINTGTTIVTFWLVFLIQATQTRDTAAIQLKLDELIRVTREARNDLVGVEERTAEEIAQEKEILTELAKDSDTDRGTSQ